MARARYAWLLDPLPPGEFEATYYQRRICVIRRQAPDYYRRLLSLDDLDLVLGTHTARHPEINVVRRDRDVPTSEYVDSVGIVDPLRAARLFADGATLIFSQLHQRVPSLARLCTDLRRVFSSRIQTNIYLTPPNSQGFAAHWDTHDVFVLQVAGRKRWTIYDTRIALPMRGQQFHPDEQPGAVTEEFEIEAGDMAYIPRGVMHAAAAAADPSLHITTGLLVFTWADLLLKGVEAAALADVDLRESLPPGFADGQIPAEDMAGMARAKLARVSAFIESAPPFDYFAGELVAGHRSCFVNLLGQISRFDELTLASTVRVRPDAMWDVRDSETAFVIVFGGNQVEVPRFLRPALDFLRQAGTFAVKELPDCVDDAGKLTLVKRLVKEGLLECPEPAG